MGGVNDFEFIYVNWWGGWFFLLLVEICEDLMIVEIGIVFGVLGMYMIVIFGEG